MEFYSINNEDITKNINISQSKWHINNCNTPIAPIVCIVCDRFIIPDSNLYLSLNLLNKKQKLLYIDPIFNLSPALTDCYKISLPNDINVPDSIINNILIDKCLLSPRSCYNFNIDGKNGFNICKHCHSSLMHGKRPKFCIANNYCYGTPPPCLMALTEIELAIITPIKTHNYCFCYTGGQQHQLIGSLAYFKSNQNFFIRSIASLVAASANIIIILYGDLTQKQYQIAKQKNRIRIPLIKEAISWLLQNNQEWKSYDINNFDEYILEIQNPKVIRLCDIKDDTDDIQELHESFHIYYPDGSFTINTGGQESIEVLQELVREASINNYDIACKFNTLKASVSDYKDNNLVNICLLQFPFGRGGIEEKHLGANGVDYNSSIDIQELIEYMSLLSQPHFHEGLFTLILYNMHTKQSMVRNAHWQIRNKLDANVISNQITVEDIEKAINSSKVARGINIGHEQYGQQFLRAVDAICNASPHSNDAAKKAKGKAQAIQHKYGCPTIFLTVTPDDDNNYTIQILSGEIIDYNNEPVYNASDESLTERSKARNKLRLKYPGLCALFFEMAINTIITEVFGWDMNTNKQKYKGLFGKIDAYTCSIEEQGRGSLHAHFLIWLSSINKMRENLHDVEKCQEAETQIKKLVDKYSSCRSYFNDDGYNNILRRKRKRFLHECTTKEYRLPQFPDDKTLYELRSSKISNEKVIKCNYCDTVWNYMDLQNCYLKNFVKAPRFSSIEVERRVKRLKTMAIEYQKNLNQITTSHYPIDFGYNLHYHTPSCFKQYKSSKIQPIAKAENNCRYRYPQKPRPKTCIQKVTEDPLPWYKWFGEYEERHILEICIKRYPYDVFQNVYCPFISYSKLTCNTNITFLVPGPIGEYCFNYSLKGTQHDDTEPYSKLKNVLQRIFSEIKYHDDERAEALRKILFASFKHQSSDTIKPTLAAYLTRKKSRFLFSHDFCWCPLKDLKSLLIGEKVSFIVSFNDKIAKFHCSALHYLCRPLSLENICPYEFYSNYEIVRFSKTSIAEGGERLIKTVHFTHPSFNHRTELCNEVVIKRKTPVLVQLQQYLFTDAANFECNILNHNTPITTDMENYSHNVLLLFYSYRCNDDLKINNQYTTTLRYGIDNNIIKEEFCNILQNIQDCKANSFRFHIKNDDLDRATEPFRINNVPEDHTNIIDDSLLNATENVTLQNIIDSFLLNPLDTSMDLEMINDNTFVFDPTNIRNKGVMRCGYDCLPEIKLNSTLNLHASRDSIIQYSNEIETNLLNINSIPKVLKIEKNTMALIMNYDEQVTLNLQELTGIDSNIEVLKANGTARSIVDWAIKCNLDETQKRAFEIITGYYILSYFNSLNIIEDDEYNNHLLLEEKYKLEYLVGRQEIKSDQLICFLHGPAGSGKSTIVTLLQIYSREYHTLLKNDTYNRSIVVTAMTGVAATIIHGETTHSALYINSKIENITLDQIDLWTNTKLLVVDEISFATNEIIFNINKRLSLLKDKNIVFGGIHIIFCGDLRQLEPVNGKPLYLNHETQSCEFKTHINCYIELKGNHRFKDDPEWGDILTRFREGCPLKEDIVKINTRVQQRNSKMPHDIKYCTHRNRDRDSINTGIFLEKLDFSQANYYHTNDYIIIFADNIKIKKNEKYVVFHHKKLFYEQCGEDDIKTDRQGRIDPVLKLYKGCEVMLTENIDVLNGLANGTRAIVHNIILKLNTNVFTIQINNNYVKGVYASDVQYIELRHQINNVTSEFFKIHPKQANFKANIPMPSTLFVRNSTIQKEKIPMQAIQLPILVNNATTGHKLQGTGVDKLFVHGWHYKRNWPYVVLSRVKNLSGLYLRRNLSSNISQYKMSPQLVTFISYLRHFLPNNIDYNTLRE